MKLFVPFVLSLSLLNCSSPAVQKITASETVQNRVLRLCQYQSAIGSIETLLAIMYPAVNSVIEEGQGELAAGAICDAVARAKRDKKAIALPSIKVKIEIDTGESKVVPIEGKIVAPPVEVKPSEVKPVEVKPVEAPAKMVEVEKPKE